MAARRTVTAYPAIGGATITVDPVDGVTPVEKVTPLVKAVGEEIGVRTAIVPRVQLAASLWTLKVDSELLFIGDGGSTEPSRASRRTGVELSAYYNPIDNLIIDADVAWSRSRFTEFDPAGDRIPNAIERSPRSALPTIALTDSLAALAYATSAPAP